MINISKLVRPNIRALKPYSSARDEFSDRDGVFLDANENPFGELNRYPDPYQNRLKELLAELKGIDKEHIFIGNGSDEVIDLAFRIFCEPSKDKALTFSPTYGMYDVSAAINDVELIKIPLTSDFQIDVKALAEYWDREDLKLLFICSPNNPTANVFNKKDIEYILQLFNGIVIIDEAYIDFSTTASWIKELEQYPNLIISQTFSKAWGLAAARVGVAYTNKEMIQLFNKVKPPYNVSDLNQNAAIKALVDVAVFEENRKRILTQKERLITALNQMDQVLKVYPSDANFLLIEVPDANRVYQALVQGKIIVRNRHALVNNCIRITVGKEEENQQFITTLENILV